MIINLLATWIPALLIALLGVLKLTGNPRVAEEMSKVGVDTSVSSPIGSVSNLERMQTRQLGLIFGVGLLIVGVILFATSKKSD